MKKYATTTLMKRVLDLAPVRILMSAHEKDRKSVPEDSDQTQIASTVMAVLTVNVKLDLS